MDDRVLWHLTNWANWQRNSGVSLWYPSRASGGMGHSGSSDFDSMCANADSNAAHAVDTIIDELPARERYTVYNAYLATVFVYRGSDDERTVGELFQAAKDRITKGLEARGIW